MYQNMIAQSTFIFSFAMIAFIFFDTPYVLQYPVFR